MSRTPAPSIAARRTACTTAARTGMYPLSKRTSVFCFYSRIFNKKNATYDFAINELGISAGADPQTFALGMRHVF